MKTKLFSAQTIKRFTSVHSWVGICTGMALFIAFFCGALVVYEEELHQWTNPGLRRGAGDAAQLDRIVSAVAADPAAKGNFTVSLGEAGQGPVKASYFEIGPNRQFVVHTRALDDALNVVPQPTISTLRRYVNRLHFTLGIPGALGYNLMGIVSLVYALALVTGLLIHLPHLVRDIYELRTGKNLKKMWTDAHNVIGVLSLPFHLMFAITAVVFCLSFTINEFVASVMPTREAYTDFQKVARAGSQRGAARAQGGAPSAAMLPPATLIATALRQAPQMLVTSLAYRQYGTTQATVTVQGVFTNAITSRGAVELSALDGALKRLDVPGQRDGATLLNKGYMDLHIGHYGGEVIKFVYFVLGMAGAFLFYSGNLLWVETRRKRQPAQARSSWIMARLSVGVCLGCCLGIGLALAGNKVIAPDLAGRGAIEQNLYLVGFFAALAWSFVRVPVRAAIQLLWACAAVYLALPILNALMTGDHLFRAVRDGLWGVVVIDVLMLASACSFAAMAWATRRRALFGQPNSVWSLGSSPAQKPATLARTAAATAD